MLVPGARVRFEPWGSLPTRSCLSHNRHRHSDAVAPKGHTVLMKSHSSVTAGPAWVQGPTRRRRRRSAWPPKAFPVQHACHPSQKVGLRTPRRGTRLKTRFLERTSVQADGRERHGSLPGAFSGSA
jgi:hypothetical protein